MIIEVKRFKEPPEGWFHVLDGDNELILGDDSYARVMDESEYILVEKTTADEFNVMDELEKLTIRTE